MSRCSVYNSYKQTQQKEPLVCHKIPTRPWQNISSDLFKLNGIDYFVITDRYSNFFELAVLRSKTFKETIASWNLISQDADCQIQSVDSVRSIGRSLSVKIRTLLKIFSLKTSPRYPQSNRKPETSMKGSKVCTKESCRFRLWSTSINQ